MSRRSSNVQRSQWAVSLLDVQPDERVLEVGCGPGVAVAALSRAASRGLVVGVDHSEVMIQQARRRNAAAVRDGRVRLVHASVEHLPSMEDRFDAGLAVNTVGFWHDPVHALRDIGGLLRDDGRLALVSQPRCRGATAATSQAAAEELAGLLTEAGFAVVRVETLDLTPPAVCVLATRDAA